MHMMSSLKIAAIAASIALAGCATSAMAQEPATPAAAQLVSENLDRAEFREIMGTSLMQELNFKD